MSNIIFDLWPFVVVAWAFAGIIMIFCFFMNRRLDRVRDTLRGIHQDVDYMEKIIDSDKERLKDLFELAKKKGDEIT